MNNSAGIDPERATSVTDNIPTVEVTKVEIMMAAETLVLMSSQSASSAPETMSVKQEDAVTAIRCDEVPNKNFDSMHYSPKLSPKRESAKTTKKQSIQGLLNYIDQDDTPTLDEKVTKEEGVDCKTFDDEEKCLLGSDNILDTQSASRDDPSTPDTKLASKDDRNAAPNAGPNVQINLEDDVRAEHEAEKAMHNCRIEDFNERKMAPGYNEANLLEFQRNWLKRYGDSKMLNDGGKVFQCHVNILTGRECVTNQEYTAVSINREVISIYFGHNKSNWQQIPRRYQVPICRKDYQTLTYKVGEKHPSPVDPLSVVQMNLKLIRAQLDQLEIWRPDGRYTIQLNDSTQNRLMEFYKSKQQGLKHEDAVKASDNDAVAEPERTGRQRSEDESEVRESDSTTTSRRPRTKKPGFVCPIELAAHLDTTFCRREQTVANVRSVLDYIDMELMEENIQHLPPLEFLLEVRPVDSARMKAAKALKAEIEKGWLPVPFELLSEQGKSKFLREQERNDPQEQASASAEGIAKLGLKRKAPADDEEDDGDDGKVGDEGTPASSVTKRLKIEVKEEV